jgi:hypothetical protein
MEWYEDEPDHDPWLDRAEEHTNGARFDADLPEPLDWAALWDHDDSAEDFLVAPVIAKGRSHEIYAGAKSGKSELVLYLAAMRCEGLAVLDSPAGEPIDIVYIDLEMTEDDVRDRLADMGFAGTVFKHFHYYLLPALPPLDTREGGAMLARIAARHGAVLVIIDTIGRAVGGEENTADTIQAFHRHTGVVLKAAGVAVVRLDHGGKDLAKGARGSSAKVDDVDVVYRLERTDGGTKLTTTHRRVSWVPERIDFVRDESPVRYGLVPFSWPAGTTETARMLDALGAPLETSRRAARRLLEGKEEGRRNEVISAALKWRRQCFDAGRAV